MTLLDGSQVSDRCPLGYLLFNAVKTDSKLEQVPGEA